MLLEEDEEFTLVDGVGMDEIKTWLGVIVDDSWTDPTCGDNRCDLPFEYKSFGQFGCQADCGPETNLRTVGLTVEVRPVVYKKYEFLLCSRDYQASHQVSLLGGTVFAAEAGLCCCCVCQVEARNLRIFLKG